MVGPTGMECRRQGEKRIAQRTIDGKRNKHQETPNKNDEVRELWPRKCPWD